MQLQNGHISYRIKVSLGNHGIGTLCFCLLCQATWSISIGKAFHSSNVSQELGLLNSSISKLVRWKVILSEYRFVIEHIPGDQNIVADGLTRVNTLMYNDVDKSKRHLYQNDSISRILRRD